MRRHLTPLRVVRGLALLVLALVVFGNSYGHFHTDIKPEVYMAPGRMIRQFLSSWSSTPYLGAANFNVGLVPVLFVTWALRAIGLSPEVTFKVCHLVLWVVGAWGAGRLLRELVPRVSRWAVLVTGVVFLANPYTIAGGSTLAIALPMCLLPWLLVGLVRAMRTPSSWAWPAAAGLLFFAMSGMNVAIVPIYQLLMAIPLVLVLRRAWSITWVATAKVVARCALFVVGLSLYWLVPALAALGTGEQVVRGSESLDGIAKVSSYLEVLRGLGMWTLYGSSDDGAWMPEFAIYITSAVVVLFTVLWPTLSLLSLRWAPPALARFAAISAAIAAVVMVGLYPGDPLAPAGWVMDWAFEHLPGIVAFRTSNKIGAVLTLAFSLALGYGAHHLAQRLRVNPGMAPLAVATSFAVLLQWAIPAVTNNLYTSEVDVPDYWRQAAAQVDQGAQDGRVLLLPGQARASYRWSEERPDDLTNSLLERDAVIPETTASTSAGGANLLAALDDTFQTQQPYDDAVSTYARYLGVDQVLLRHDTVWEAVGGARPAATARLLSADPGLVGEANFGRPGENTSSPAVQAESFDEAQLTPLQLYGVRDAEPVVRAKSMRGSVLVAGDGWAIPPMARDGLLTRTPVLRYASDLRPGDLGADLGRDARIVLTDTNQRRESVPNRLTAGNGPLLPEGETPGLTRALGDAEDQTVLTSSGIRATASDEGAAFFTMPNAVAQNAVDGDPRTAWIFGDFRRAPGATLDLKLPRERTLDEVTITQRELGPVLVDEVALSAGGRTVTGSFDGKSELTLDLGGVRASAAQLKITSISGEGFNLAGISEVDLGIPDRATRVARLPRVLDREYGELNSSQRRDFATTPLDVFLTRTVGTPSLLDDPETELRRVFSLPDDRTARASARVRMVGDWEGRYDRLAGAGTSTTYRSSGVFFNNPDARASRAADGDDDTAWVPDGDLQGAWWQERSRSERTVSAVAVVQGDAVGRSRDETRFAEEVEVSVDGEVVATGTVGRGRSVVRLDEPVRGKDVRLTVTRTSQGSGEVGLARFRSIDTGLSTDPPAQSSTTCLTVATIDGRPLRMRPDSTGRAVAMAADPGAAWEACDDVELASGEHELRPVEGFQLDAVALRDVQGLTERPAAPAPAVEVDQAAGGRTVVRASASRSPYAIVLGQGYDSRWRAFADGQDLGPPQQLDGYSSGWVVEDSGSPHEVHITFGPQRAATVAALVSATFLLAAVYLLGAAAWRQRSARDIDSGSEVDHEAVDPAVRSRALDEALLSTPPSRLRLRTAAILTVAVSTFAVGLPGLLASLVAVLLLRRGHRPVRLVDGGAALVALSAVVFVLTRADTGGTVSADVIAASIWPHSIAGAGLVLAVTGALWRSVEKEDSDEPVEL